MRWRPFRRSPEPLADTPRAQKAQPAWQTQGRLEPTAGRIEVTAPPGRFLAHLVARQPLDVALAPLGHDVSLGAPAGIASGIARVATAPGAGRQTLVPRRLPSLRGALGRLRDDVAPSAPAQEPPSSLRDDVAHSAPAQEPPSSRVEAVPEPLAPGAGEPLGGDRVAPVERRASSAAPAAIGVRRAAIVQRTAREEPASEPEEPASVREEPPEARAGLAPPEVAQSGVPDPLEPPQLNRAGGAAAAGGGARAVPAAPAPSRGERRTRLGLPLPATARPPQTGVPVQRAAGESVGPGAEPPLAVAGAAPRTPSDVAGTEVGTVRPVEHVLPHIAEEGQRPGAAAREVRETESRGRPFPPPERPLLGAHEAPRTARLARVVRPSSAGAGAGAAGGTPDAPAPAVLGSGAAPAPGPSPHRSAENAADVLREADTDSRHLPSRQHDLAGQPPARRRLRPAAPLAAARPLTRRPAPAALVQRSEASARLPARRAAEPHRRLGARVPAEPELAPAAPSTRVSPAATAAVVPAPPVPAPLPPAPAAGSRTAPLRLVAPSHQGAAGASRPVQRLAAASAPAATEPVLDPEGPAPPEPPAGTVAPSWPGGTPPAAAAPSPPSSPAAHDPAAIDELAAKLYEPIRVRLKAELLLDRERAGFATDLR